MSKSKKEMWEDASTIAKERWLAFEEEDANFNPSESWYDIWELKDQLEAIDKKYYLEDRSSDEGILCGVEGTNDEEEDIVKEQMTENNVKTEVQIDGKYVPILSAMYCEHANENPAQCTCPANCYCQFHTCKDRPKCCDADICTCNGKHH